MWQHNENNMSDFAADLKYVIKWWVFEISLFPQLK